MDEWSGGAILDVFLAIMIFKACEMLESGFLSTQVGST